MCSLRQLAWGLCLQPKTVVALAIADSCGGLALLAVRWRWDDWLSSCKCTAFSMVEVPSRETTKLTSNNKSSSQKFTQNPRPSHLFTAIYNPPQCARYLQPLYPNPSKSTAANTYTLFLPVAGYSNQLSLPLLDTVVAGEPNSSGILLSKPALCPSSDEEEEEEDTEEALLRAVA